MNFVCYCFINVVVDLDKVVLEVVGLGGVGFEIWIFGDFCDCIFFVGVGFCYVGFWCGDCVLFWIGYLSDFLLFFFGLIVGGMVLVLIFLFLMVSEMDILFVDCGVVVVVYDGYMVLLESSVVWFFGF